jgi:hypothetical protein
MKAYKDPLHYCEFQNWMYRIEIWCNDNEENKK